MPKRVPSNVTVCQSPNSPSVRAVVSMCNLLSRSRSKQTAAGASIKVSNMIVGNLLVVDANKLGDPDGYEHRNGFEYRRDHYEYDRRSDDSKYAVPTASG